MYIFWSHLTLFFLEWKMFQTIDVEGIKTHLLCSVNFVTRKSCRLWDNEEKIVEPDRLQMTIWRMRIVCWITKSTDTNSEVILITFLGHKWLRERAPLLCYTYTACLVHIPITNNPYPTAFPYGNGMVLHFYQQQESSTTKTVHKVINRGLKTYV